MWPCAGQGTTRTCGAGAMERSVAVAMAL
uniref:Uncharacterized protein n=1 Tax=Arundo donax TaxID=35708 RepID=A0A0A9AGZ4_ARUDO